MWHFPTSKTLFFLVFCFVLKKREREKNLLPLAHSESKKENVVSFKGEIKTICWYGWADFIRPLNSYRIRGKNAMQSNWASMWLVFVFFLVVVARFVLTLLHFSLCGRGVWCCNKVLAKKESTDDPSQEGERFPGHTIEEGRTPTSVLNEWTTTDPTLIA